MDDIQFQYYGDISDEAVDAEENQNEDYEVRTVRVNEQGQKIRGRDLSWQKKISFNNMDQYNESALYEELKDNFTRKRMEDFEYGECYNYVCKFNKKTGYLHCQKKMRIIFPADSCEVLVQEHGVHEHIEDPDYVNTNTNFQWSKAATDIVIQGIRCGATPTIIRRNMREAGLFDSLDSEPDKTQLYNKISYLKKALKLNEGLENTHELRQKIAEHTQVPESDFEGYVAHHIIEDEDPNKDVKFVVIFTTKKLLSSLRKGSVVHVDATYRLNW